MRPPKIRDLSSIVLFELYRGLNFDSALRMRATDLATKISGTELWQTIGAAYITRILEQLAQGVLVTIRTYQNSPTAYEITDSGIETVETLLEQDDGTLLRYEAEGIGPFFWGGSPPAKATGTEKNKPEDSWSPLPIDRSAPTYDLTMQAVEEAIAEIGKSNGYASEYPEERESILTTLKTGLDALRQPLITRRALDVLLTDPLKFVAAKFSDAAFGTAASKAFEMILKFFGLGS